MLKEMLSEAVREALQVEREKAPVGDGKQTPMDPKIRESPSGSGKCGGYSKDNGHWAPRLERMAGAGHAGLEQWTPPGARQAVPGSGGGHVSLGVVGHGT